MTVDELRNKLDEMKVSKDMYSIMQSGYPNEHYTLYKKAQNGKFIIANVEEKVI